MKFHIENTFRNIGLRTYEALYFDDDFNAALAAEVKLDRIVKRKDLTDGHVSREVLICPDREIPAPAAKILGTNKIEYTEYIEYTYGSFHGTWRTVPGIFPGKVTTEGAFRFVEVDGGVLRAVDGEIKVSIFGIGGMVEKVIVADIEKSYERATAFTQHWIDAGKAKPAG